MNIRIGQGYDTHRLAEGNRLVIGGLEIEHEKGCVAHSDGDVLLHALTDAILGSISAGDIGELFPDTSPGNKDRNSVEFVKEAVRWLDSAGFKIKNIDSTVIIEKPKLSPFKDKMKNNIAAICEINPSQVNVKAKTNEKLDAIGREEAIMAQVIILVESTKGC
ncbi:MAG: 2-C-methyl-D-erythritol 2,4-cyclodiphosphate synthase [Planctomycetota bacterium]|jgi:2-C-methyl-D-erythritol 2,4-cyclodiphosphate synthase